MDVVTDDSHPPPNPTNTKKHLLPSPSHSSPPSPSSTLPSSSSSSSAAVAPFQTILSKHFTSNDFERKYELFTYAEIGRGGFSVVYKCQNRYTKEIYAVKV